MRGVTASPFSNRSGLFPNRGRVLWPAWAEEGSPVLPTWAFARPGAAQGLTGRVGARPQGWGWDNWDGNRPGTGDVRLAGCPFWWFGGREEVAPPEGVALITCGSAG